MKERRAHPRFEVELPVILRTRGRLIPAACIDLSQSGICVLTEFTEEVPEGLVEVIMDLSPRLRDISLRGRILRSQKGIGQKVAIQFTSPQSQGYQMLSTYLTA